MRKARRIAEQEETIKWLGERLLQVNEDLRQSQIALAQAETSQTTWCMTVGEFIEAYQAGLESFLESMHGNTDRRLHPEDLASAALTYAEVHASVYENINWRKITGATHAAD